MNAPVQVMLTPAQRLALEQAAQHPLGLATVQARTGSVAAHWEHMMRRLETAGMVKSYALGGYRITQAGRAAIKPKGMP